MALGFAASILVSLTYAVPAQAQVVAPDLGAAGSFTVLGSNEIPTTGTVTCTRSSIDGDVGSTGNEITIVTLCDITGDTDAPVAAGVVSDFGDAYDAVETLNPLCDGPVPTATTTLAPGVYCSDAGVTIGADVTITLDGDADDVWVFRIGTGGLGALTGTGPNLAVLMGGTADACNVYWWTAEAATMTNAVFVGNVLSGAAVTMTDTIWEGRALATTDVTLTDSEITGCAAVAAPAPATITILKQANPSDTDQLFTFTGDLGNFSLMHGEFIVETRPSGTYAVSETLPAGWQLDSATCSDGSPVGAIVLEAGENVTCTFSNSLRAAAISVPIFSQGGIVLIILMMLLMAAAFMRRFNKI